MGIKMALSVFDLFSIGVGPSSSHTVGPMRAAYAFVKELQTKNFLSRLTRIQIELFGSLALTGKGHGTDVAVLNGLEGLEPEMCNPDYLKPHFQEILQSHQLNIGKEFSVQFNPEKDLLFRTQELLPKHTNGMRFTAFADDTEFLQSVYYSIGGGFIVNEAHWGYAKPDISLPYPFETAEELLKHAESEKKTIAEIMLENEKVFHSEEEVRKKLLTIAETMESCIQKGIKTTGILPGVLKVKRRAPELYQKLALHGTPKPSQHADIMNWLNIYAMAVNEENAAGGRIVTAPTNGAAGIIPAVLQYYKTFCEGANEQGIIDFLLTAGAIAILYKLKASISGAEVGCQGEVGTAASMAAGALAAVLGGNIYQVENAAEIAMEHHLGMTCDPIAGLVQIPCIERNAMGSVKAVNAARLALLEDGNHKVSLDKVIKTMYQTGKDMMSIYKETSLGGLAVHVNITEC